MSETWEDAQKNIEGKSCEMKKCLDEINQDKNFDDSQPGRPTTEEFENEGFTLKAHQMFFVHTTLEEFKNADLGLRKPRS